jgi:hypothetical protein
MQSSFFFDLCLLSHDLFSSTWPAQNHKKVAGSLQGMHIHVREHCICKLYCLAVLLAMKLPLVTILQAPKQPQKTRQPLRFCLYQAPVVYLVSVHVTLQHLDLMVNFLFCCILYPACTLALPDRFPNYILLFSFS